jgi:hypothetical protein
VFHKRLEIIKKKLEKCKDFSAVGAFSAIDTLGFKYLDISSIKKFLRKQGHKPTDKELNSIIRRIDLDADSRITFTEFTEAIKPVKTFIRIGKPLPYDNRAERMQSAAKVARETHSQLVRDDEYRRTVSRSPSRGSRWDSPLRRSIGGDSPLRHEISASPRRPLTVYDPSINLPPNHIEINEHRRNENYVNTIRRSPSRSP